MLVHQRRMAWTAKLAVSWICANAHPAQIVVDVVDAIGNGAGELGIDEVVHINDLRQTLTTPYTAGIGVVPSSAWSRDRYLKMSAAVGAAEIAERSRRMPMNRFIALAVWAIALAVC